MRPQNLASFYLAMARKNNVDILEYCSLSWEEIEEVELWGR
jgi:hypothetical protein